MWMVSTKMAARAQPSNSSYRLATVSEVAVMASVNFNNDKLEQQALLWG